MVDPEKAFMKLFETHVDELFSHCVGRVADREKALALTEEAFLAEGQRVAQGAYPRLGALYHALDRLIRERDIEMRSGAGNPYLRARKLHFTGGAPATGYFGFWGSW